MHIDVSFAFTQQDTPALRARIENDLRHIARRVSEADPHLAALVLTGGFSRGEGTTREDAPLNDYDLVAVRETFGGGSLYERLHHELSDEVGLEVDLMPVWRRRLPQVDAKLFWHDLRLGGRVLTGDTGVLDELPRYAPAEIPRSEAARLLGNRAAGLLRAVPGPGQPLDETERRLQATKAVLAAMDARLLSEGVYAARLADRLELARRLGLPDIDAMRIAVDWKLATRETDPGEDWWNVAKVALLRAVEDTGARDVRDGFVEHAFHLVAGRRFRASPSAHVRRVAWALLEDCTFPEGPQDTARADALLRDSGTDSSWPSLKRRFFKLRAATLQ